MVLPAIEKQVGDVAPADAFNYAPPAGRPRLRELWAEKLLRENPSLAGKRFSLPVVTHAITHGLALVGDLFLDPGDVILLPDKLWGNYRLTYEVRLGASIETYSFYAGQGFDTAAFAEGLEEHGGRRGKVMPLLNFPNNPTGYMPTEAEGEAIADALVAEAERGTRVIAVCDDAYTGLFYHLGQPSMSESLFGRLVGRHPNLLAIRLDGATKELFVWGLRVGFVTFGPGRAETADSVAEVLDAKTRGAIRGGISNASQLSQTLVERGLSSSAIEAERQAKHAALCTRAEAVHDVVNEPRYRESWEPYPFNSGYFMCVKVKGVDAEQLRLHLLDEYGIGLISTSPTDLRIAFSCLELEEIEPLFEDLHKAIQDLANRDR
jgi:aspartate/methionine/tyrosine aminotransferase